MSWWIVILVMWIAESVVNVYALDFSGQLCWMALYSESHDAEFFGPGEYFVLLGLADYEEAVMWAEWYTGDSSDA